MSKTPVSIKVISILGIIWGGLGALATPCMLGLLFVKLPVPNPAFDAIRSDPVVFTINIILYLAHFALALLLLAASIASLKLIPWGRIGMIVYAIALLVQTVIGHVVNVVFVLPRMFAAMAAAPGPGGAAAVAGGKIGGFIGLVFGVLFALAIAGVILYFFTRLHVINAFKGIFPADPTDFPVLFPEQPLPPPR